MNLIEELGLEKCQAIVDGAPSNTNYKYYSLDLGVGAAGWHCDYREGCFALSDLRAAIADHNKCQHEWNEATSNGDKYRFFVCKHCDSTRNFIPLDEDITDYCSDIRNHISPLTKVIER